MPTSNTWDAEVVAGVQRFVRQEIIGQAQDLEASDSYYASPVGGDGKVYALDEIGRLTVISATDQAEVLHTADFKEDVFATPAIVDGRIYLRTAKALYCFGIK